MWSGKCNKKLMMMKMMMKMFESSWFWWYIWKILLDIVHYQTSIQIPAFISLNMEHLYDLLDTIIYHVSSCQLKSLPLRWWATLGLFLSMAVTIKTTSLKKLLSQKIHFKRSSHPSSNHEKCSTKLTLQQSRVKVVLIFLRYLIRSRIRIG